jgi:phage gp46-like protein
VADLHSISATLSIVEMRLWPILWSSQRSKQMRSVAKTSRNFFSQAFEVFGAAVAASAAVRAHRQPSSTDLNTLGIDAKAFNKVQF